MKTISKIDKNYTWNVILLAALFFTFNPNIVFGSEELVIEDKPHAPENVNYYLSISDTFITYNNYDDCIWALNKAQKCDPANANVYLKRGYALLKLGYFKKAIKDILTANQKGISNAHLFRILGIAYYNVEEIESAISALNAAIVLEPASPQGYYLRGLVYKSMQNNELANMDIQKAMTLNNNKSLNDIEVLAFEP